MERIAGFTFDHKKYKELKGKYWDYRGCGLWHCDLHGTYFVWEYETCWQCHDSCKKEVTNMQRGPLRVSAYKTSDGSLYEDEEQALKAQQKLDLDQAVYDWVDEHINLHAVDGNNDLVEQLLENIDSLREAINVQT